MKERDFDCYQRYTALKLLLDMAFTDDEDSHIVSVLDVGAGKDNLSATFLGPRFRVTRADVVPSEGIVLLKPGEPLPFEDRTFDVVIAMDVLEHVPPAERPRFVHECIRVARDVMILAAPTAGRDTEEAEVRVYATHRALLGSHAYFDEHVSYGLPQDVQIRGWLTANDTRVLTLPNVPLIAWETFSALDFIGYSDPETRELTMEAHILENDAFPAVCSDTSHYRTFYIVCRPSDAANRLQQWIDELLRTAKPLKATTPLALAWRLIAGLCQKVQTSRSEVHAASVEAQRSHHQLLAARDDVQRLAGELDASRNAQADLHRQLYEHQVALTGILNSRSWRYTSAIRNTVSRFRNMSGKWLRTK